MEYTLFDRTYKKSLQSTPAPCKLTIEMKIVADKNMPLVTETFGRHGEVVFLDGRGICASDLEGADVLLVRSVTRVNQDLLKGTHIRFVGSATIGIDHLDTAWLEANNIPWAHAPGCNADAAAQYALAMMWLACDRLHKDFRKQSVGIIGRGNVGRRLEHLLEVLGIPVMACDPPLQEQGEEQLVSMEEACTNSIISLHVPLTTTGRYPTRNLFDLKQLAALQPGTLMVNTSRGGVIEKTALLSQLQSGQIYAALDVWPNEPYIAPALLNAVTVASPHIAGYSLEGKHAGTETIYRAFCKTFAYPAPDTPTASQEPVRVNFPPSASTDEILQQLLQSSCPVARDDATLRALPRLPRHEDQVQFDGLRSAYPQRREFKSHLVSGPTGINAEQLRRLGFRIV